MADNRYGRRDNSIFSDDDRGDRWRDDASGRWRAGESGAGRGVDHGWRGMAREGQPDPAWNRSSADRDERGFFERAGDEIRSWFGDEEAERRRERDAREDQQGYVGHRGYDAYADTRGDARGGDRMTERSALRDDQASRGYGQDDYSRGGYGDGGFGGYGGHGQSGRGQAEYGVDRHTQARGGQGQGGLHSGRMGGRDAAYGQSGQDQWGQGGDSGYGRSHYDDSYRQWRDRQIAALDREYDDYRQHRQQQFEQEFTSFRQTRQGGITSGGNMLGQGEGGSAQFSSPTGGADVQQAGDLSAGTEGATQLGAESGRKSPARTR